MKRLTLAVVLAALLGGCVVAPYGDRDDDGYRHWRHGDYHGDFYGRGYQGENTRRGGYDH